jgi:hypothetical protein
MLSHVTAEMDRAMAGRNMEAAGDLSEIDAVGVVGRELGSV